MEDTKKSHMEILKLKNIRTGIKTSLDVCFDSTQDLSYRGG